MSLPAKPSHPERLQNTLNNGKASLLIVIFILSQYDLLRKNSNLCLWNSIEAHLGGHSWKVIVLHNNQGPINRVFYFSSLLPATHVFYLSPSYPPSLRPLCPPSFPSFLSLLTGSHYTLGYRIACCWTFTIHFPASTPQVLGLKNESRYAWWMLLCGFGFWLRITGVQKETKLVVQIYPLDFILETTPAQRCLYKLQYIHVLMKHEEEKMQSRVFTCAKEQSEWGNLATEPEQC